MNLRELRKRHLDTFAVLAGTALAVGLLTGFWIKYFRQIDAGALTAREAHQQLFVYSSIVLLLLMVFLIVLRHGSEMARIRRTQNWLIDATNWNIERLKAHGLCRLPEDAAGVGADSVAGRWPWGEHHTELLGHLDAAARKFWTLYDPDDPSTAPTNDMVSDWLQNERGVSKDKAKAIASILRVDGLPTGPRR